MMLGLNLSLMTGRAGGAAFSVSLTGLTDGEARIGDHATISYTTAPVSATETVKWSNSADPAAAATYGTGANPTDYTAGDEGALWLHVTDTIDEETSTVSRSAPIRYAPGTASSIADGQTFTVDTAITALDASASGANLTFTYALTGGPAGLSIDASTGSITGTPSAASSGTATVTATDQYGRTLQDTFTFTASLRAQATATGGLGPYVFAEGSAISAQNLAADFAANGNTLTYSISGTALPAGLNVSSTGSMTGTPSVGAEVASYTVRGTDEYGRTTDSAFNITVTGETALFLIVGQSNAIGRATFDSGNTHPAQVFQWNQSGAEVAASIPLDHNGENSGDMGFDIEFARSYIAANPTHKIVFIPDATGGTGFADNQWNAGDTLYNGAVSAANAAIANYGVASLKGVLWHQGERDAVFGQTQEQYRGNLQAMILAMRSAITGSVNAPFVVGEIGAFLSTGTFSTRDAINLAINETDEDLNYTAVVETGDLTDMGDSIHFSAAALRTMGTRYYTAWAAALANVSVPVIAGVPTISGTKQVGGTLTATAASVSPRPTATTWQWERSGVAISGATNSTYTLAEADEGTTLTVVQTETSAAGFDSAESAATETIAAAPSGTAIENAVDGSIGPSGWFPTDSFSNMYQDITGATTPVTANTQPVGWITSASGSIANLLSSETSSRPYPDVAGTGLIDFQVDITSGLIMPAQSWGSDVYFAFVGDFLWLNFGGIFFSLGGDINYRFLHVENGKTTPSHSNAGSSINYKVNGVSVAGTRQALYDATAGLGRVVVEIINVDMSAPAWSTADIGVFNNNGERINTSGDLVVCDTPSASDQDSIRAELAARHGITLP